MCRKQYRAGYLPHLMNKDIARWARRNGGNSKTGRRRKIEAQGLVGDWGKLWGIPEKEGHRQMPPREPRREMEGRVGNCRVTTAGMKSKQVRKYSFRKTCKLSSTRHINLSPKDLEGLIAGCSAAPMAELCAPKQLLVTPVGDRRVEGKADLQAAGMLYPPTPMFPLRVTYSAACPEVLGTKWM